MPETQEELETISKDYAETGLPGCCGSMDVVHTGWDKCPSELTPLFKGKEGYPSLAFQVIVSHRRKVLYVSLSFPGARNDKQIVKVDSFPVSLHNGSHWLRTQVFHCNRPDGSVVKFRGHYLIVDGGYLRWPSLICPIPNDGNEDVRALGKHLESIRKDVECTFGSLKKRFKCLKAWSELFNQIDIANQFVTCCVLHNMLLEYDGYLNENYSPDAANVDPRGDGIWVADVGGAMPASEDEDGDVSFEDESGWVSRIKALAVHFACVGR